jgi:ribosomal protein L11 methyltransferase
MIELMLAINVKGLRVLDIGCGTGILSIFASKLGAKEVLAIDIDSLAVENSIENCRRNGADSVKVMEGNIQSAAGESFDIILANINRNILLADMNAYTQCLNANGILLLSGILAEDRSAIHQCASDNKLKFMMEKEQGNWMAIGFKKD